MQAFTSSVSALTEISAIASNGGAAANLVHGTVYSVKIEYRDAGNNPEAVDTNTFVTFDTAAPTIVSASIDYSIGKLVVTASEELDVTEGSWYGCQSGSAWANCNYTSVDLSKFYLSASTGANSVSLVGATVAQVDSTVLRILLTEAQRVAAIAISGTPGGDSSAVVLDVSADGIRDRASNGNTGDTNVAVTESADILPANVTAATINYDSGVVVFTADETIELSPSSVSLGQLLIVNAAGESSGVSLSGASVATGDGYLATITLTETSRVAAIAISGTSGGDGGAAFLKFAAGAFTDVGQVASTAHSGVAFTETADTTALTIASATINYGSGMLSITASETIDATPTSFVNLGLVSIGDAAGNPADFPASGHVTLSGATVHGNGDAYTVYIQLTEEQRVHALKVSGTKLVGLTNGDGGAAVINFWNAAVRDIAQNNLVAANGITLSETADTTVPTIREAYLNYENGTLTVFCSETMDLTPSLSTVVLSSFALVNTNGGTAIALDGASVTNTVDSVNITIALNETQRTLALGGSGVTGGDGTAVALRILADAIVDIGDNKNAETTGIRVFETADLRAPSIVSATLEFSTGTLTITADETIDTTPATKVDFSKISISNNANGDHTVLNGATVAEVDDSHTKTVVITLTEAQRVAALAQCANLGTWQKLNGRGRAWHLPPKSPSPPNTHIRTRARTLARNVNRVWRNQTPRRFWCTARHWSEPE